MPDESGDTRADDAKGQPATLTSRPEEPRVARLARYLTVSADEAREMLGIAERAVARIDARKEERTALAAATLTLTAAGLITATGYIYPALTKEAFQTPPWLWPMVAQAAPVLALMASFAIVGTAGALPRPRLLRKVALRYGLTEQMDFLLVASIAALWLLLLIPAQLRDLPAPDTGLAQFSGMAVGMALGTVVLAVYSRLFDLMLEANVGDTILQALLNCVLLVSEAAPDEVPESSGRRPGTEPLAVPAGPWASHPRPLSTQAETRRWRTDSEARRDLARYLVDAAHMVARDGDRTGPRKAPELRRYFSDFSRRVSAGFLVHARSATLGGDESDHRLETALGQGFVAACEGRWGELTDADPAPVQRQVTVMLIQRSAVVLGLVVGALLTPRFTDDPQTLVQVRGLILSAAVLAVTRPTAAVRDLRDSFRQTLTGR